MSASLVGSEMCIRDRVGSSTFLTHSSSHSVSATSYAAWSFADAQATSRAVAVAMRTVDLISRFRNSFCDSC
eukprot:1954551-Alexandrium_andersonii.AAC.1